MHVVHNKVDAVHTCCLNLVLIENREQAAAAAMKKL